MVHALEIICDLLSENGILIDIHPTGEPPTLAVSGAGAPELAGYLQESDDFIEYAQADAAIASAIQLGWYRREQQETFTHVTIAFTMDEFQEFLDEKYQDAIVIPETRQRIQAILAENPANRLIMSENILITRLCRVGRNPEAS